MRRKLPGHIEALEKDRSRLNKQLRHLKRVLKKEEADVNKLQRFSVKSLFYRFLKSQERQLEIELQEYVVAALRYNECLEALELLEFELAVLEQKVEEIPQLENHLDRLLIQKERLLKQDFPEIATLLHALDLKVLQHANAVNEVDEALKAGMRARAQLRKLTKELGRVRQWGHWSNDLSQGRLARKTVADRAYKTAIVAQANLKSFERELHDVFNQLHIADSFNLDSFENFLNSLYDTMITDWMMQRNLRYTSSNVSSSIAKVDRLLMSLKQVKQEKRERIRRLKKEQRVIILVNP